MNSNSLETLENNITKLYDCHQMKDECTFQEFVYHYTLYVNSGNQSIDESQHRKVIVAKDWNEFKNQSSILTIDQSSVLLNENLNRQQQKQQRSQPKKIIDMSKYWFIY
ncbi:hypothetical protein PPL_08420 [Heterostelium album PN500]|uniref:Uncharacterized protein n=1 Tax=Heterostelium pallidum (strain ATCC 26659 / Pp 5 / PN500) TaxID=670386 RepID=D3BI52_HETP5|nr:hypothetical protein PPL_08420 [Heterostelium album PN500]EFA78952.1 hypothetical protein PPL_08420 [Heterostelium album PN500]|eukprot:XP_020431076.1 hypothetical protein PPL_08420 [Heterostelium album PN500]